MAEYSELGRNHVELHACAKRIFKQLSAGTTNTRLASAIRELSEYSIRVIAGLQALEQAAFAQTLANAEAPFLGEETR
jgi:hypothetical protein